MKISTLLAFGLLIGAISAAAAPLGTSINWNGYLTGTNGPASGPHDLRFSLYLDQGTNLAYGPVEITNVVIKNGVAEAAPDFGAGVFDGTEYYLLVEIRKRMPPEPYTSLLPLQRITAAPYALHAPTAGRAAKAGIVESNGVDRASLQNGAVTTEKISPQAVDKDQLKDEAVDGPKIKGGSIGNNHLAPEAVDGPKIKGGSIGNSHLASEAVDGPKIKGGSIGNSHLAAEAVDGPKIKGGSVGKGHLAIGAVDSDALTNAAVTLSKLNTNGAAPGQALFFDGTSLLWQALAGNGSALTNLNASNLTTGIVPEPRLSANVALLNGSQTFTGVNPSNSVGVKGSLNVTNTVFAGGISLYSATLPTSITLFDASNRGGNLALSDGPNHYSADAAAGDIVLLTGPGTKLLLQNGGGRAAITVSNNNVGIGTNGPSQKLHVNGNILASGTITGNGAGLTSLNAANLTGPVPSASLTSVPAGSLTGTIADSRLSANVAQLNGIQTFTGANTFNNPANSFAGAFTGNGLGLTSLNADNLASGTLSDARLSLNVARLNANQTFNGSAIFQGNLSATGKLAAAQLCVGQGQALGGLYSSIAGGFNDTNLADAAFIGGGDGNSIVGSSSSSAIVGGSNNRIETSAAGSAIGGGRGNLIQQQAAGATISGGTSNRIQMQAARATIVGGSNNVIGPNGQAATISGGQDNAAGASYAAMGGGQQNTVANQYGTVAGGFQNKCQSDAATVGGGAANTIQANSQAAVIAGGWSNWIETNASSSAIGGGNGNLIQSTNATISGGMSNRIQASATSAAIGGGTSNAVGPGAVSATIGGGEANIAGAVYATVSGGQLNANGGMYATITGGIRNTNNGIAASVGGGSENSATGGAATVPGGDHNSAGADYSFAAGHRAKATHTGSFVWADSLEFNYGSIANNEFSVRATGGARIVSGLDGGGNPSAGVSLAAGSGSWSSISDRHAKTNVAPVDARGVLDRLARLPLATWSYKTQDPRIRHIGPMAQDFAGAFQVGEDDTHIATVDANGVALAAIQGLNQKLEEQLDQKQAKVSALEQRLAELEKLVDALTRNQGGAR